MTVQPAEGALPPGPAWGSSSGSFGAVRKRPRAGRFASPREFRCPQLLQPGLGPAAVRTGAVTSDLAGAWVVSTSSLGIAAGAALGGAVLERAGIQPVAWAAAVAIAATVVVIALGRDAFPATP